MHNRFRIAKWRRRNLLSLRKPQIELLESRTLLAVTVLPDEQLMVYLINRARHDPVAYQVERGLPVDLSYVTPRPPLAVNNRLFASAQFHAKEMATYNYFGHQSQVTGDWPNKMARDQGYNLPDDWTNDGNYIESLVAGTHIDTPAALATLIVDEGIDPPGHRIHLLGIDGFNADNREIGVGYAVNPSAYYVHYWAIHATRVDPANQFLTGVVFSDTNANRRYDLNEGLPNVIISTGSLSTTTNSAGGWSLPIPNGQYVVTASGGSFVGTSTVPIAVNSANVEIDFISGRSNGYRDFVEALNTAPTLDTTPSPTLKPVLRNTANPPGDVISGIVGSSITDPDPVAQKGIALINATNLNDGSWQYSTNAGASWTSIFNIGSTSALLLRDTDMLRFVPKTDFTGTVSIDYRAWDRTAGAAGARFNISVVGGITAFSTGVETATLTIVTSNTAPTLKTNLALTLPSIPEDTTSPASSTIASILGKSSVTDPDPGTHPGVAVYFVAPASEGAWQYSLDSGSTFTTITSVSLGGALLLRDTDMLRFVPAPNFSGDVAFSFRAWDQSTGSASAIVDVSQPSLIGGTTAFSTAYHYATITVTPINDSPILNPNGPFVTTPVRPSTTFPVGDTVASIVGDAITDADLNVLEGIAVIGTTGDGHWWYNNGGTSWWSPSTIASAVALLLKPTSRFAFVPNAGFTGTATFTFRAWDQTTGPIDPLNPWYADLSSASSYGGTTAYSAATATATVYVADPATIQGTVFKDLNGNGIKNVGETALSGWAVYVDADNDSQRDSNERSATTNAGGAYTINNLVPGVHTVRIVLQGDTSTSNPVAGFYTVTVVVGGTYTGKDFAVVDNLPTITIADSNASEGSAGTPVAGFIVSLSKAWTQTITVNYATSDGSAKAPSDYATTQGTLSFTAGQTSKVISIAVVADTTFENDETFTVTLSSPTNATLAKDTATATLVNDDQPCLTGAAGDDSFYIRLNPAGDTVQFWQNASTSQSPTYTAALSFVKAVTLSGLAGIDTLGVDLVNGNPLAGASLNVDTGWVALSVVNSSRVVRAAGLSVALGASLDLAGNNVIIRDGNRSTISNLVKSGRLTTSYAAGQNGFTGLAVVPNDNGDGTPVCPKLFGQSLTTRDLIVRYTWNGDANLDGLDNADDYFLIDSGYITKKGGYYNGDFNYDNLVNADDYFLIDSAFIGQTGMLAPADPEPILRQALERESPERFITAELFSTEAVL